MAHECPVCDFVCHCLGDVGDIVYDDPAAENDCIHCRYEDDETD